MPSAPFLSVLAAGLLLPVGARAGCISASQALKHIGETKCIAGKVAHVETGSDGIRYVDFCDDPRGCSFVAVILPADLKYVGDVSQLPGKSVEVHGDIRQYDGRAVVVVSESRQLKGEAGRLPPMPKGYRPPMPKGYDVEERGNYSSGIFRHPKAARATSKKRQLPTLPAELPDDSEE